VTVGPTSIGNDRLRVEVAPDEGGRVAQITVDGVALLVAYADAHEPSPLAWGSYPMVPWAGRIRHGRFRFDGEQYELPVNFGAHAIHGVGFGMPWTVTHRAPDVIALEVAMPSDTRWPFGGVARQRIRVDGAVVRCELSAHAGERAMPTSLGWHPWFRKPAQLDFRPRAMYRRDDEHIAVDELVTVPEGPWDDCFVNEAPVALTIAGVDLRLDSDCRDWVVYDMPAHATCIEPQSAPPDAFNLHPNRIEPGESVAAWFEISVVTNR
jgi:aldose 1-epimerase